MDADTTSAGTDVTVNRQSEEAVSSTTEGDHPASEACEEGGSGYAGNEGTGRMWKNSLNIFFREFKIVYQKVMMKILVFDSNYHLSNKFMAHMLKVKDICLPDHLCSSM